jgi:hypothetical protein
MAVLALIISVMLQGVPFFAIVFLPLGFARLQPAHSGIDLQTVVPRATF